MREVKKVDILSELADGENGTGEGFKSAVFSKFCVLVTDSAYLKFLLQQVSENYDMCQITLLDIRTLRL